MSGRLLVICLVVALSRGDPVCHFCALQAMAVQQRRYRADWLAAHATGFEAEIHARLVDVPPRMPPGQVPLPNGFDLAACRTYPDSSQVG
jgi:hypothetical protein